MVVNQFSTIFHIFTTRLPLGIVSLKKKYIIIDSSKQLCLHCNENTCNHYTAFQQCSENSYVHVFVNPIKSMNIIISILSVWLRKNQYNEIINSFGIPELTNFIEFCSVENGNFTKLIGDYPNVNKIVQMLSRHHPITGLFQLSILTIVERKLLVKLSQGLSIDKIYVSPICSKIYALKLLFNSIPNNNDVSSFSLHQILYPLLNRILIKVNVLLKYPSRRILEFTPKVNNFYDYFPTFHINYM